VAKIKHDFGINITFGHIRGKDVRGQYNRNNKGVRTKVANNLPTIAHELGHHIDNVFSLRRIIPADVRSEIEGNLSEHIKESYSEKKWVPEGIAEYMREYLQNREVAADIVVHLFYHRRSFSSIARF